MAIIRLAGAALAALLLAGCSAAGRPAAGRPTAPSLPPATSAAATSAAVPSPQGAPLSIKQAGQLFAQIEGPPDRASAAFGADAAGEPPSSQFQAAGRAFIAAVRVSQGQLSAGRWPAQVQPYITSMITTYQPAEIACTQAQINAGSYAAAQNVSGENVQCSVASQDEDVSTIREMLNLPA